MKKTILAILATLALAGCRREDWRETTVDIPGLSAVAADGAAYARATEKIRSALTAYEGVRKDSLRWDASDPTKLTLRFDSLLIAEMNIIKAIEETGCAVKYPELKKGAPAGYIDARRPEVD